MLAIRQSDGDLSNLFLSFGIPAVYDDCVVFSESSILVMGKDKGMSRSFFTSYRSDFTPAPPNATVHESVLSKLQLASHGGKGWYYDGNIRHWQGTDWFVTSSSLLYYTEWYPQLDSFQAENMRYTWDLQKLGLPPFYGSAPEAMARWGSNLETLLKAVVICRVL